MAGLNDTLTLGLILVLLFGAASLYLYTRIQQCEQKLNLVESILLDIKMSAELQGYPEPPPFVKHVEVVPPSTKASPFVSMDEQELYQGALDEALDVAEDVEEITEVAPTTSTAPEDQSQSQSLPQSKVTTNFESMTLAELKGIAKQRGLSGISSMKRSQLLDALKPKGVPADGGILSALAEQGSPVESS